MTKVRKSLTQVFKEFRSDDFVYVDRGDIVNLAPYYGNKRWNCRTEEWNSFASKPGKTGTNKNEVK